MANRNISYQNRDFDGIKDRLINFSQTYFPTTYTDFDANSPGIMFMEQASYVSDVLSFYLDNQVQETYLQYARQDNNIYDLAYMFGYKPKLTGLASTDIDFYQLIPAKVVMGAAVPDYDYALQVGGETLVTSDNGTGFIIEDSIDFTVSNSMDTTEVSVAQIANNEPTYFLLKKTRKSNSGNLNSQNFNLGAYSEFPTIQINNGSLAKILSIVDSEGNNYSEVDNLAQDLVFIKQKNSNINDPNNFQNAGDTPYILQTKQTQYRFVTRHLNSRITQIQFGSGKPGDTDESFIPNPDNVGLGLPFQKDKLTTAFSPSNFVFTNTYGIAPSNTTITIRYLSGGGVGSNINANSLTNLDTSKVKFLKQDLNPTTANYIFQSIASNNPEKASGGKDGDSIDEIRENTLVNYASQLRNVTADDYLVRSLSMPSDYGMISKAHIQKPKANEGNSTLDLYVLGYDRFRNLDYTSSTLKKNLKTYLNQYRMIGDVINIKDAYIINIGVDFEIITDLEVNNNQVIRNCIQSIKFFLSIDNFQLNQPILVKSLENLIDNINGVQTVKRLTITNKVGIANGYSKYAYDIDGATQNKVIYPSLDPMIFEIKNPNQDITGRVVTL
jgi:hypothetical protein|tara:strand:+ start:724 stop:2559 length:1836 start_codon:yes stop_codon:yes gene_type:complete